MGDETRKVTTVRDHVVAARKSLVPAVDDLEEVASQAENEAKEFAKEVRIVRRSTSVPRLIAVKG